MLDSVIYFYAIYSLFRAHYHIFLKASTTDILTLTEYPLGPTHLPPPLTKTMIQIVATLLHTEPA